MITKRKMSNLVTGLSFENSKIPWSVESRKIGEQLSLFTEVNQTIFLQIIEILFNRDRMFSQYGAKSSLIKRNHTYFTVVSKKKNHCYL